MSEMQVMTQAVIEATKAMVQAMAAATEARAGAVPRSMAVSMGPKLGKFSFKRQHLTSARDK